MSKGGLENLEDLLGMRFSFRTDDASTVAAAEADLCVVATFETEVETPVVRTLDAALQGVLSKLIEEEQFAGKKSQSLMLHTHGKLGPRRLLLLGVGKRRDFVASDVRTWAARATRAATSSRCVRLLLVLPDGSELGFGDGLAALTGQFVVEGALLSTYQFDKYLAGERKKRSVVAEVTTLVVGASNGAGMEAGGRRGEIVAHSVMLARDLVNEQPSTMTPSALAAAAGEIAAKHGLGIEVLGPKECTALGMGLYLAVARGSDEEPRFIHLTYKPSGTPRKKVVLVGKSVTFDSGGLSLKTTEGMLDMKVDMGGGATVLAAMDALAGLGCPDEVHVLCAATENMPSGRSYKLGDVLRSMAGKTIEINNTDAEGRLTLADAITFAKEKIQPDEILDFATLTGASLVALGPHTAAVMSNHAALSEAWLGSARKAGEEMWQLPLSERLVDMLKSDLADMKNTGERSGGTITAGLFLREFVGETPWVHVDMAGPVQAPKDFGHHCKGATGFGVATLVEYLVPRTIGSAA